MVDRGWEGVRVYCAIDFPEKISTHRKGTKRGVQLRGSDMVAVL